MNTFNIGVVLPHGVSGNWSTVMFNAVQRVLRPLRDELPTDTMTSVRINRVAKDYYLVAPVVQITAEGVSEEACRKIAAALDGSVAVAWEKELAHVH